MYDDIQQYWSELTCAMQELPLKHLVRVTEILLDCHRRGNTVFLLGNGGSAATASHFACDLAKGTRVQGLPAFRVVSLNDNLALLTAWANDTSYERIFAEQLSALVRTDDVVILISTSGNSPNVLAAAIEARQAGATSIALTGARGGRLARLVDLAVRVPTQLIEQVEDVHLVIAHSICVALRGRLCTQAALQEVEQSVLHGRLAAQSVIADPGQ
ncbi:MAG TPA: SIS domain-containing protein [Ktedonobacteraceae bacterium]|nr:SIS domain-containing protein [Ktedonobacteraceae bacterium]